MPYKEYPLTDSETIRIYKRRGNRSLHLSISATNQLRLTIPAWASYRMGLEFARSKRDWISAHRKPQKLLYDNQAIGKMHHLHFVAEKSVLKATARIQKTEINVRYPENLSINSSEIQTVAQKAINRALRIQAIQLLPQRLEQLAQQYGFSYKSVSVRNLKSRWGSCDHQKNIVLNIYLMVLPWEYIDYVLLHELTHTHVLRHGPDFWEQLERVLPNAKKLRSTIRTFQPTLPV